MVQGFLVMNKEIKQNAFTDTERLTGFTNMDGPQNRIISKRFIDLISDNIDFSKVRTVLEIGSRDGCQALELSRWFPNATVYSFEPNPSALDWVRKNSAMCSRIVVVPFAVSEVTGEVSFYEVVNGNIGASSLYKVNHPRSFEWQQREIKVQSVRLDEWLDNKGIDQVDIVWADVQGAEGPVFRSLGKYLNEVKAIATEVAIQPLYDGSTLKSDLDNILSSFQCIDSMIESTGTESDAVYIRKDLV